LAKTGMGWSFYNHLWRVDAEHHGALPVWKQKVNLQVKYYGK
jgi:hypothetical protein